MKSEEGNQKEIEKKNKNEQKNKSNNEQKNDKTVEEKKQSFSLDEKINNQNKKYANNICEKIKSSNQGNNIAIIGDNGEGKSNIIQSFLSCCNLDDDTNIREKTITINLSKYKNYEDDSSQHYGNKIEFQIINQILYQIDPKNIYLSKYKIKKNLSIGWRRFFGILAATLIFSIYNLIFCLSENIKELSNWTDKWGLWLGWLVVIIPLSIFTFFFVFYQQW